MGSFLVNGSIPLLVQLWLAKTAEPLIGFDCTIKTSIPFGTSQKLTVDFISGICCTNKSTLSKIFGLI